MIMEDVKSPEFFELLFFFEKVKNRFNAKLRRAMCTNSYTCNEVMSNWVLNFARIIFLRRSCLCIGNNVGFVLNWEICIKNNDLQEIKKTINLWLPDWLLCQSFLCQNWIVLNSQLFKQYCRKEDQCALGSCSVMTSQQVIDYQVGRYGCVSFIFIFATYYQIFPRFKLKTIEIR